MADGVAVGVITKFELTVTVDMVEADRFVLSSIVTVYVVVNVGQTVIDAVVSPVFQEYVYGAVPPVTMAVSVAHVPAQTVGLFVVTEIVHGLTSTMKTKEIGL